MSQDTITVEKSGRVLLIGLNRKRKLNAFDLNMYRALGRRYGELQRDPELRCGLLFAHGEHFTTGLELDEWVDILTEGHFPDLPEGALDPLGLDEDRRLQKPIIMAVQGLCFTIGIELLLATDVRVAASDANFGQLEVTRGLYAVGGATIRLIEEVGWGNAMRYILTGDYLEAQEALRIGLVQEVVDRGKQVDRALEIANTIARQAPLAVQASLCSARLARDRGSRAAIVRLMPDLSPIMRSHDFNEGLQSFKERRQADFRGC
jgi:enoyl-CoA hydratase/carnithine racemase